LFIIGTVIILAFTWLWTEGFGISPRYEYGDTIEKSLNFWYQRGSSSVGLSKVISIVDVKKNEKLVFYETNKSTVMVGLVKSKWNKKWVVIGEGGEIPLNYSDIQQYSNSKDKPSLHWQWHNLNDFGITFGVVYDENIDTITIGDKDAILLNKQSDRYIFYLTDKTVSKSSDLKQICDIKAYDKNHKLIYSYYPQ
jgi:hypothetical protein